MAIQITITDPSADQLAKLLSIFYPEKKFAHTASAVRVLGPIGVDNPEIGTPTPGEAFGPSTPLAPEVVLAFAPQSTQPGPTPEAAFGGNAGGSNSTTNAGTVGGPVGTTQAQPPAPGASAPSGVELDSRGLPWDARIHAKSGTGPGGTKNADGTWRAKRGLNDAALVARIEAELRAVMGAPGPTVSAAPLSPALASQVVGNVPPPPLATTAPAAPALSAVAPVPVPPAPSAAGGGLQPTDNYVEFVHAIGAAMTAGKITQAEVEQSCAVYGIPSLPLLGTRLDLVRSVSTHAFAIINSRG